MQRSIPLICGAALTALFLTVGTTTVSAQKSQPPTISAAASDPAMTTLFISGTNFSSMVTVTVSGVQLGGVLIGNAGTTITANLPGTIGPGSYRLVVQNSARESASFDITLGSTGAAGPGGPPGPPGPAGPAGVNGAAGPAGPAGANGPAGSVGPAGAVGPTGSVGANGPAGPQGQQGVPGLPGNDGAQGPQGMNGIPGPAGPAGAQGMNGIPGPAGPAGPQGMNGVPGPAGPAGPQGPTGVVSALFASAGGTDPNSLAPNTTGFVGPTVNATVTAGQKLHVTTHKGMGSTVAGGANGLKIWVCSLSVDAPAGTAPNVVGGGIFGLAVPQNTRLSFGIGGLVQGLPAGTYQVGMCANVPTPADWNSNEFGYTTVLVLQ